MITPGLDRRDFFRTLGAGVLVLFQAHGQDESGRTPHAGRWVPSDIDGWLHIGRDGVVRIYVGKAEMGQNVRTSLAQAAAEELRAPVSAIRMVLGDTDLTPWDAGTFGSRTTPYTAPLVRKAAAAAREVLIDLAAERWKTERGSITVREGRVVHLKTDDSLGFGELAGGRKLVKTIDDAVMTPATEWKIAGTSVPKPDAAEIVTGEHAFPSDIRRPGMLCGRILRPAGFQARLTSIDTSKAETVAGARVVQEGDFVGVVAPSEETASEALGKIRAEWRETPQPSGRELFTLLKREAQRGEVAFQSGSIEQGLAEAAKKLERTYTVAYIAHAPLEPRAAVAEWNGDRLTVFTGTQRPFGVRSELASAFNIPEVRVRVIEPGSGAGFGGKHTGEAAIEAARLARAVGKPVKVVWTREEEFTWAYFRPAGLIEITSGVRADGRITAWEFHNYNSGQAAIRTMYDIPNQRIEFHPVRSPLRQGSYRTLAATANHFAREMHMDELAQEAGMDPLEFRLKNLKDTRLKAVFQAAAERFGWGRTKGGSGRGFGIAGGFEKGGYVATCAEVETGPKGPVRITRVTTAFECGAIVNPRHLENQIEGAQIMGIGGALFEAIEFENGRILNPRFSRYRVPRFSDIPVFETVLVDRKDLPSAGAGETPIVGVAPAVGNAIFQAIGVRLRSMPMKLG